MSNDSKNDDKNGFDYNTLDEGRFEKRAARLRRQANWLLGMIISILLVGAIIFIFAADITRIDFGDSSLEAKLNHVETEIAARDKKIDLHYSSQQG